MPEAQYADAVVLKLTRLQPGRQRVLRLRLMEIRRNDKRPTDYFLQLGITCVVPLRTYQIAVQPDFGAAAPPRATLIVAVGRSPASSPAPLIDGGAACLVTFTLAVEPTTEWLTLWVSAEGAERIPPHMAGELRLQLTDDDRSPHELATARLPSLKTVMRQSLKDAFRQSPSPVLALLGTLMQTAEPFDKREQLSRLLALDADVRFVDAAVRDLAFAEQTERDFPPTEFDRLVLDDPLGASLAVFHPACPPPVVLQALVVAFERQFSATTPPGRRRWQELVRASAVVVCRTDRGQLGEGFATAAGLLSDPDREAHFRSLVEWATSQLSPERKALAGPAAEYLKRITDGPAADAEQAALALLRHYDMLGPTAGLG
ncbi:MAG: hypothetical protein JXB32_19435 [Deltaproteobacteria bacterium]|nr:hypothetical protein [Deltaproteobacteria bacterium]